MSRRDIVFRRVTPLRGPNIWTYRPAVEVLVDIGAFEDHPSNTLPGFVDRLTAWLPGLGEHRCGVGEPGGFLLRLREGTWMGHILEHVTLELQNLIGMRTGFGKARGTSERGVYKVVVRSRDEDTTRVCLATARELLLAAVADEPFDLPARLAPLRDLADAQFLGPSTACIVDAATERRIPSIRLTDGNLVQLGYGARSRRIWTAETDRTSAIAEGIASDKDLTKTLLQACGVPTPGGRVVDSPADAWEAAEDIGVPVVVKPSDANHGRGVSMELTTREQVEAAFGVADAEGSEVMVERYIRGQEHRLLIVNGRLAAAARGEIARVTGDGKATIRALIDAQLNTDPRRGLAEECPLSPILLDVEPAVRLELQRQGYDGESVPPAGQEVIVQRNGNMNFDVTGIVHPSIAAAGELAARIVGLDIAGIDFVADDITLPLDQQQAAVVEVNAGPSLLMHLKPEFGSAQPVGEAIVNSLFPDGESGRIPIIGVAGTRGMTLVARIAAWIVHLSGRHVGLACGDGLYFERRRVEHHDCATWQAGHRVLLNRAVEAAVFENGCRMILAEGLAYDRCQVGVVTGIDSAAGLEDHDIRELEQVYNIVRTQVDVVLPEGTAVLNAGDPMVAQMASLCDGDVIFFGADPAIPALAEHRHQGGRAVFVRDGQVVLATGGSEAPLTQLAAIPVAGPQSAAVVEQVLAAIGAAWALRIGEDLIRAGIETFQPDAAESTPHRQEQPAAKSATTAGH
ncbi:MAG: cyanophycin synthetase [Rhodocyclaceae bacterium]|nr:cyanophycin synthetase [Rhodocyclaceae bacterium]